MRNTPATRLSGILEQERRAILSGDFARLPQLIEAKERLTSAPLDLSREDAAALQQAAQQNQRLLSASLRGVRSALNRLQQIDEGARGYTGYDRNGQATSIRRSEGNVERRA
ncbi:hypothetical protein [Paenirhodobacter populi]|uniref:hypothetical protein n=1 Tax=Paenirhodobacter populi TaxID=2306993 RepID=UPI000FE3A042|nr:hypothetical protein [Sinirhodobacter populi]RWR08269.1 hypothetical protein D2T32_09050 [Sinirhodobacter populi]